jgi:hypothetical protein
MAKRESGEDKAAKKKTKAERETLHVALLVDESGSMGHMHGAVIAGVNEFINDLKSDPSASIRILTDGLENASETTSAELRKLIHAREADGWEFVYLGANQDTWAATEGIGLAQRGKHFAWETSAGGVSAALKVSGDRVKRFRDAPVEYRAEADQLSDRIAPGEAKARLLTDSERRNARRGR